MNHIKNKKNLENIITELKVFSHKYLEKYNSSKQQLRIYLFKKAIRKNFVLNNKKELLNIIDQIILNLESKNIISDKIYSNIKTESYLKRGFSFNKITHNLLKKGVDQKYIKNSIMDIKNKDEDTEYFSALKLCKKRKIGPARPESNRSLFYKKDIGVLARAGFNYDISKKALEITSKEFIKLKKLL